MKSIKHILQGKDLYKFKSFNIYYLNSADSSPFFGSPTWYVCYWMYCSTICGSLLDHLTEYLTWRSKMTIHTLGKSLEENLKKEEGKDEIN